MGSLGKIASTSARGSFTLFVGNALSLLVSASGAILVARMLSPSEYGLFSVSLVLPGLFMLFSDWGVNSALTRFIARFRSEDGIGSIWELERAGFLFKLVVGGILSLTLFLLADILAAALLRRPDAGGLVRVASLLIISQSMHSTAVSVLAGLDRMDYRSVANLVQAIVKGVCSPSLVYLGFGVSGAVIGHILSYIVAASVGFLFTITSSSGMEHFDKSSDVTYSLRLILDFGMPLFLGSLVTGFASRFNSFLLSWFESDEVIGNYHVASRFTSLVALVTGSIGVTLFPTFSKFSHTDEPDKTREVFRGSVRYSAMVVLPLTLLLAAVSEPTIYILFTAKYPRAPLFFQLLLVPMLLVGLGSLSIGNFLNSQGDTGITMKIHLFTSIVSILLSPILVWIRGVYGLIISSILSGFAGTLLGLLVLRKEYSISPNFRHTGMTLLCSTVSAVIAYVTFWLISASKPLIDLFVVTAVFLAVYILLAPITGAIEAQDIENLDSMLGGLRIVYPITRLLLNVEEKILRLKLKRKAAS